MFQLGPIRTSHREPTGFPFHVSRGVRSLLNFNRGTLELEAQRTEHEVLRHDGHLPPPLFPLLCAGGWCRYLIFTPQNTLCGASIIYVFPHSPFCFLTEGG